MSTEIYTHWNEFYAAVSQVLSRATRHLCLFDTDLAQLHLEQPEQIGEIQRLLADRVHMGVVLRIALRETEHLTRDFPRLVRLLTLHSHAVAVKKIPYSLSHLRETLIVADDNAALIRFDLEQPRSKIILDDDTQTAPYLARFEDIWAEGGEPFYPTPLGL